MYYFLFLLFLLLRVEPCLCSEDQDILPKNMPSLTLKRGGGDELNKEQKYKKRRIDKKDNLEVLLPQQSLILVSDVNKLEQINEYFEKIHNISFCQENSKKFLDLLYVLEQSIKRNLTEEFLNILAIDNQIKYKTNKIMWIFDKWPHQTWVEAVMGELFYPNELRNTDDLPCDIYERPTIRYRLGLSASYNNPLAYHHLSNVIANYFSRDKEDQSVHKKAKSLELLFKRKSNSYFLQGIKEGNHYIKAISSWNLSAPESSKLMKEAIDNQREYRLLSYIGFNHNQQDLLLYYHKALGDGYTDVLVKLSNIAESAAESVLWSLKAAEEENIASGYYKAALKLDGQGYETIKTQMNQIKNPDTLFFFKEIFNRDFSPVDIMTYLDKAGDMGMVAALREKAKILSDLDEDNQDAIENTYMKAANNLGDEYSWYSLGLIYIKKGYKEQAEDCFQKAGIRGYFSYLKEHVSAERKQQILVNICKHLHEINDLSNGKRL